MLETIRNEEKKRDNRWTNVSAKGHKEGTHACKKNWRVFFFLYKREIVVQKKRVQEEGDQENKRSNKKEMKKEVNAKRDEQKQESDEKRTEEKLVRKKNTKHVSREIHF